MFAPHRTSHTVYEVYDMCNAASLERAIEMVTEVQIK